MKHDDSDQNFEDEAAPSFTHGSSRGDEVVERILRRGERAEALGAAETHGYSDFDGDQYEADDRSALKRVSGLSTELQDITDVEYRQLRLEKVILIGLWGQNTLLDAENSLRELAALAETAGATVLDGLLQRRSNPDQYGYNVGCLEGVNPFELGMVPILDGVNHPADH